MINPKLLHDFVANWTDKGYEKGESQPFWLDLLHALGIEAPAQFIEYEQQVHIDHTAFIDGYIPSTNVMIEQKSIKKDLGDPIKQSDGSVLNPFQQAKRYAAELPYSKRPRWIVTCNFREFWVYDMEQPNGEPQKILLQNLEKEWYRLEFLIKEGNENIKKEMELSIKAGDLVGKIYDAIRPQYANPDSPETLQSLNQLCVRLVFCLFAEDAGLFGDKNEFHDYLSQYPAKSIRRALIDLFKVLDTKPEDRDPYLDDDLKVFPYVNGGLFSNENIEIPQFTEEIKQLLLAKASEDFDWSEISPTIFGAVFESTLNPETRRSGGMHYTSIENIHKVIDPLFLNQLYHEFDACATKKDYERFQDKLASLTFFDPACGSGNFLTETYVSLRRLENKVIQKLQGAQIVIGDFASPIKVDIHQFYGIEINDFAVSVATTALWIAELQMMRETEKIVSFNDNPLPLKAYHNIHEGNALRLDWGRVVPTDQLNYIMGNPPFVGYSLQSEEQKKDILSIMVDEKGKPYKMAGKVDYVAGWYYKTAQMMHVNPNIRAALVSTNSITQGEQVAGIWQPLFERFGIHFDFAYPTFRWDSESSLKAHVHCVIIGFSANASTSAPRLYLPDGTYQQCKNINPYLVDAKNIFIEGRNKPLCDVPEMQNGGKPTEGGFLILSQEEKKNLIAKNTDALKFIRPYMMGKDFIDRKPRYCLWMVGASPSELRKCPLILQRIESVRNYRLQSPKEATRKKAYFPMLFDEVRECTENYVAIPKVSSEKRRYIPMDYLSKDIIPGDKLFMLQSPSLYLFGVLTSNVHMSWMRAVCGRLKSDYSYSNTIVYNNFPWPTPTDEQKAKIEQTAQAILDARAKYPDCSLADLYDEVAMPVELRKAHRENDRAVMATYGFSTKMSESDCVARLLEMYQQLVK
ncbi:MAG: methylase [Paludibacteraceae bacterium]|nr:methylase [Paludibacteraceae bacterium]